MSPDQIIHLGVLLFGQLVSHFFTREKIQSVQHDVSLVKNQVQTDLTLAKTTIDQAASEVTKVAQVVQAVTPSSTPSA